MTSTGIGSAQGLFAPGEELKQSEENLENDMLTKKRDVKMRNTHENILFKKTLLIIASAISLPLKGLLGF